MMKLSNRVLEMEESVTLAASARAAELKAQGRDILSLTLGEPDFTTPENIQKAAIAAIQDGKASFYTAASGLPALKDAISSYMETFYGYAVPRNQVVVATGAKFILYAAFATLLNPGDEVIIPTPCWVSYVDQVKMVDGVPVTFQTTEANDFKATVEQLEAARTEKTKLILLNSPSNPTGMIYSREELEAIGAWALEHDILILADDIYGRLVYNGHEFTAISSLSDALRKQTIVVNGVSKTYAMTGWRIGYALGPRDLIEKMGSIQGHLTSNPAAVSQWASVGAMTEAEPEVETMRKAFEERRHIMLSALSEMPLITLTEPEGAFYVFVDVRKCLGKCYRGQVLFDDVTLCKALLEGEFVAAVPGSAFLAQGYLRLSYANSVSDIREGMERFGRFLAEL